MDIKTELTASVLGIGGAWELHQIPQKKFFLIVEKDEPDSICKIFESGTLDGAYSVFLDFVSEQI